jgi:hypothetical protein
MNLTYFDNISNEWFPYLFDKWNRSHQGAYRKGRRAWNDGVPFENCPYPDTRKDSGRITWSRVYRNAWKDGWRDAKQLASQNGKP